MKAQWDNVIHLTNAGESTEKLDHSYIAGGDAKWHSHSGKEFGSFFNNQTYNYRMTQNLQYGACNQRN